MSYIPYNKCFINPPHPNIPGASISRKMDKHCVTLWHNCNSVWVAAITSLIWKISPWVTVLTKKIEAPLHSKGRCNLNSMTPNFWHQFSMLVNIVCSVRLLIGWKFLTASLIFNNLLAMIAQLEVKDHLVGTCKDRYKKNCSIAKLSPK